MWNTDNKQTCWETSNDSGDMLFEENGRTEKRMKTVHWFEKLDRHTKFRGHVMSRNKLWNMQIWWEKRRPRDNWGKHRPEIDKTYDCHHHHHLFWRRRGKKNKRQIVTFIGVLSNNSSSVKYYSQSSKWWYISSQQRQDSMTTRHPGGRSTCVCTRAWLKHNLWNSKCFYKSFMNKIVKDRLVTTWKCVLINWKLE